MGVDIWCGQKTGNLVPVQISFLCFASSHPQDRIPLCSPGCLGTCSVDQADLLFCFETLFQCSVD